MTETEARTPQPFLTDVQHPLDGGDAFHHADYVATVAAAVPTMPSPFTLGLFGPWGAGKSSILDSIGREVEKRDDTAYVSFDVWRYEGDPLRRQFITDVTSQLKRDKKLKKGFDDKGLTEALHADSSPRGRPYSIGSGVPGEVES